MNYLEMERISKNDLKNQIEILISSLSFVDKHLLNKKFLVGNSLTFPDVNLICILNPFIEFILKEKERKLIPNIINYYLNKEKSPEFAYYLGRFTCFRKIIKSIDK